MDKSTGSKAEHRRELPPGWVAHKQAVLQPSGPGRAFKGLDSAKRYCRRNSIGDRFSQGWSHPLGLVSQADAPSLEATPYGSSATGRPALRTWRASKGPC